MSEHMALAMLALGAMLVFGGCIWAAFILDDARPTPRPEDDVQAVLDRYGPDPLDIGDQLACRTWDASMGAPVAHAHKGGLRFQGARFDDLPALDLGDDSWRGPRVGPRALDLATTDDLARLVDLDMYRGSREAASHQAAADRECVEMVVWPRASRYDATGPEAGQVAAEYAVVLAVITLAVVLALGALGDAISQALSSVVSGL